MEAKDVHIVPPNLNISYEGTGERAAQFNAARGGALVLPQTPIYASRVSQTAPIVTQSVGKVIKHFILDIHRGRFSASNATPKALSEKPSGTSFTGCEPICGQKRCPHKRLSPTTAVCSKRFRLMKTTHLKILVRKKCTNRSCGVPHRPPDQAFAPFGLRFAPRGA